LAGDEAAASTLRELRGVLTADLPDERRVTDAARVKGDFPLAYADAFAAATARQHDAELWTATPSCSSQRTMALARSPTATATLT
jgi:hypothetical protein